MLIVCDHHGYPLGFKVALSGQTQFRRPLRMTTNVVGRYPQIILRFTTICLGQSDRMVLLRVGFEALYAHVVAISVPLLFQRALVYSGTDLSDGLGELLDVFTLRVALLVLVAVLFARCIPLAAFHNTAKLPIWLWVWFWGSKIQNNLSAKLIESQGFQPVLTSLSSSYTMH